MVYFVGQMKKLYKLLLLSTVLFSFAFQTLGQEIMNVSAGFGFPELLNVAVRIQSNQSQIGFSLGSFPGNDEKTISFSADYYYHFAGESKLSERRPWYGKGGINYLREEKKTDLYEFVTFNLRLGRDINFSKRFGMAIDAGALFVLSQKGTNNPSGDFDVNYAIVNLSAGLGIFYRIFRK